MLAVTAPIVFVRQCKGVSSAQFTIIGLSFRDEFLHGSLVHPECQPARLLREVDSALPVVVLDTGQVPVQHLTSGTVVTLSD